MLTYPHLSVKYFSGMYWNYNLKFIGDALDNGSMVINIPITRTDNNFSFRVIAAVLNKKLGRVKKCIVWGPSNCSYIDEDGRLTNIDSEPSGMYVLLTKGDEISCE